MIFELVGLFKRVSEEAAIDLIESITSGVHPLKQIVESGKVIKEKKLRLRVCLMGDTKRFKALGHEFRTLKWLNERLIDFQKKEPDFRYFVPLACKVEYRGFAVLITSMTRLESCTVNTEAKNNEEGKEAVGKRAKSFDMTNEIEEEAMVFGPTEEGQYIFDRKTYDSTSCLAHFLNLRPHSFRWSRIEDPLPISLAVTLRLFRGNREFLREISQLLRMKTPDDPSFSLEKPQPIEEFEHYYLENSADICPLQLNPKNPEVIREQSRFRPEFIQSYRESLSSDVFLNAMNDEEGEEMDLLAIQASEDILKKIENMIDDIGEMKENPPISSKNLQETFHKYGVNMRFLGEFARKSKGKLIFLEKMAIRDMVARTLKEIFRVRTSEIIDNWFKNGKSEEVSQVSLDNSESGFEGKGFERNLAEEVVDMMNLVFGRGRENELFWKELIRKKLRKKFDYFMQIDSFDEFQVIFSLSDNSLLEVGGGGVIILKTY